MADPFDVSAPATRLITDDISLSQTRVHQQATQDSSTGLLYFTQIISGGRQLPDEDAPVAGDVRAAKGHLAINQVSAAGALQSQMYVRGFDHGSSLAVETEGNQTFIWMSTDVLEAAAGLNGYGRQIVRLPYRAGTVVDFAESLDLYNPFPDGREVALSIDFVAGQVAVARRDGGGNRYATYRLADFRAKNFRQPLADFASANREHRQAFTLFDGYVYEVWGQPYGADVPKPGNTYFTTLNASTGALLATHHRVSEPDLVYREIESIGVWATPAGRQLVYGWAVGDPTRRAAMYAIRGEVIPPDPGKYHSWQELLDDDRPNYEFDPGQDPGPDNPERVPMNEEGRDYDLLMQEEAGASPDVAFIAVQDGRLDATSSLSAQYLGAGADQWYVYAPHVAQIPWDPPNPEPPERTDEELRIAYTEFDEPQCVAIVAGSRVTVSFGRYDAAGAQTLISGRDRERATAIRDALRTAGFAADVVTFGDGTGDPAAHIVNKNIPKAGVHLDISDTQRRAFMTNGDVSWERVQADGMAGTTNAFLTYHNAIAQALGAGGDLPPLPDLPTLPPVGNTDDVWELGCNSRYAAEIRETRTGIILVPASELEDVLTAVSFDRRLNEVSQAKVSLKFRSDLSCCQIMEFVEPAMFDLVVYRDDDVVWEGPIVTVDSSPQEIAIEARDMGWWVSRIVNSSQVFRSAQVGKTYAQIAYDMIMWCTQSSSYTPLADWCRIKGYVYPWPTKLKLTRGKAGVQSKYMLEILEDLTAYGIEWTCVGRGLHLRQQKDDTIRALATLGTEDLSGQVHVIRSAEEGATRVFVTNQSDSSSSKEPAVTVTVGRKTLTPYGRLDWLVNFDPQVEAEGEGEADKVDDQISKDRTACKKRCSDTASREKTAVRNNNNLTQKQKDAQYDAIDKRKDSCSDACDKAYDKAKKDRQAYVKNRTNQLKAQEMLAVARVELANRYPMPVTIKVNDGAKLSPNAPLQFSWLVPGERFDVISDFQCRPINQAMRLTGVAVSWASSGESVGISLAPAAYEEQE